MKSKIQFDKGHLHRSESINIFPKKVDKGRKYLRLRHEAKFSFFYKYQSFQCNQSLIIENFSTSHTQQNNRLTQIYLLNFYISLQFYFLIKFVFLQFYVTHNLKFSFIFLVNLLSCALKFSVLLLLSKQNHISDHSHFLTQATAFIFRDLLMR